MNKNEKTLNIPMWVAQRTDLSATDKLVYSIYYYFTFYGDMNYCFLTNNEVAERIGCGYQVVQRSRRKLANEGWIESCDCTNQQKVIAKYRTEFDKEKKVETKRDYIYSLISDELRTDDNVDKVFDEYKEIIENHSLSELKKSESTWKSQINLFLRK